MPNDPKDKTFIEITNVDIYVMVQELSKQVQQLNIKFYGLMGGIGLPGLYYILHLRGVL